MSAGVVSDVRIAELLGLRVQDVDFLRRTVRIEWQLLRDGKRRVPPKTLRSRPMLALPKVIAEFRHGKDRKSDAKAGRCGRQTSIAGSITATSSKTASATLEALLLVAETFQQFGGPVQLTKAYDSGSWAF
jgi:hypothetical protein